ncbi:hypothetical protein [Mucilaginibacter kameinonensis]|uniref:hypothetical protein n=1 Tax=Mucilaginibacter kameinonensis TaxID=452286 RepID=UPI000EF76726|nr:hypothetical protein [Mucilaginibacter kameinonensis]
MKHSIALISALLFLCLFCIPNKAKAQANNQYNVLGSFVFQNNVYNYTYKQTTNGSASFQIEQIEGINTDTIKSAETKLNGLKEFLKANADSLKIDTAVYDKHIDSVSYFLESGVKMFKASTNHLDSILAPLKTIATNLGSSTDTAKTNKLAAMIKTVSDVKTLTEQASSDQKPQLVTNMDIETFKLAFKNQLAKFVDVAALKIDADVVNRLATDKFVEIQARIKFKDDQPLTAYLQLLSKQVNVYTEDEETSKRPPIVMNIDDIQFEFESGTIKNIYAQFSKVDDPQQKFFFQNTIPISISGKFASTQFFKNRIFAINPKQIHAAFKGRTNPKDDDIYFRLNEVIRYVLFLETQKEDYSPEDKVYRLSSLQTSVELKKQLRSKILTVKAFTDFNGMGGDKPNGLIQFEASLHANIVTYHKQVGKTNFAFVSGSDLLGTLNKIDDNHKYLQLTSDELNKEQLAKNVKMFGVRPIELLRYQSSGVSVYSNIIKYSIPDFATSMSLNSGYGIILTSVSDSLKIVDGVATKIGTADQRTIYSRIFNANVSIEFSPDSRYGFKITYGNNWLGVKNTDVVLSPDASSRLAVLEFSGFLRTNDDSKLFFRWRNSNELHHPQFSYNQVQVGYIVDIFKATK